MNILSILDLAQSGEGRVALVTGAASGMGLATTRLLLHCGYRVVMFDASPSVATVEFEGSADFDDDDLLRFQVDITKPQEIIDALAQVERKFGGVDALVNCAGIVKPDSAQGPNPDDFRAMLEVNLVGTFNMIYYCHLLLIAAAKAGRDASIITIGSIAGELALPARLGYCATKGGVHMLMQSTALWLAPQGVDATVIAPGRVLTSLVNKWVGLNSPDKQPEAFRKGCATQITGTMMLPDDVAGQILFLLSPLGRWSRNAMVDMSSGWGIGHQAHPATNMPAGFEEFRKTAQALYPNLHLLPIAEGAP
jgi:NAD(P)-dependent dehydrogenase (short-subunit alcohol dehydrogenase family)